MRTDYKKLSEFIDNEKLKFDEPMSKYTTLKIGGPADVLLIAHTIEDLKIAIQYAKENNLPITLIGNGSKLLVLDGGIRGIVIKIGPKFGECKINGEEIYVSAGLTLPYLARVAKQNLLSGLEFACGIPGTIGGAIYQNAGAYSSEMSNIVEEVTYLDENLNMKTITRDELEFGYRTSYFKKNKDKKLVIISAKLRLNKGDAKEIETKMDENTIKRKEKQPLEYPSAGSTFKRPEGYFVGKLIDDAGLKGKTIGGAQVSTKHSGFIVNIGDAKAKDVLQLINYIKEEIYAKFGVKLEEEIIIMGDE